MDKNEYVNELKDEGLKFIKYFKAASWVERLAMLTFVVGVFFAGALIF